MGRILSHLFSAIALLAIPSIAAAATYVKSGNVGGTGTYNLSVTTDNTVGALGASNILAWIVFISDGTGNFTLTQANSAIGTSGSNLTATGSDLLFNFSGSGYFFFQNPTAGSSGPFFCWQGTGDCFDTAGGGIGLEPVHFDSSFPITRLQGTQVVASVAGGVPEPATWAMMLFGFGGIGMAMRRGKVLQIA